MSDKGLFAPEDVVRDFGGGNCDVLYTPRAEIFFVANEDGSPSNRATAVFHTQWWHYSGLVKRAETLGPRIEKDVQALIEQDEVYDTPLGPISAAHLLLGMKAAFVRSARRQLGIDAIDPEPEPEAVE